MGNPILPLIYMSLLALTGGYTDQRPRPTIKIAFVSTRFRQHAVAKMVLGLMASLPRPKFHVVAVSFPSPVDAWAKQVGEGYRLSYHFGNAEICGDWSGFRLSDILLHLLLN